MFWSLEEGLWVIVFGFWSLVFGGRSLAFGLWSLAGRKKSLAAGLWRGFGRKFQNLKKNQPKTNSQRLKTAFPIAQEKSTKD